MNRIEKWWRSIGIRTTDEKEASDIYDYITDDAFGCSDEFLADKKSKGWELLDQKRRILGTQTEIRTLRFRRLKSLRPKKEYTVESLESNEPQFKKGQKVRVIYHNVMRGPITVFEPPQEGVIVDKGERKTHTFALGYFDYEKLIGDGKCRWYWVKFPCGTFEIPNTCIELVEL